MSNTIAIVVLSVHILESFLVFTGNIFTVFVFWIHRNELKRTSFILINLAFADLLVGLLEIAMIGTLLLPRHSGLFKVNPQASFENISISLQFAFSGVSMFFLVLISLERAFALIWPLRHRITSIKTYINSVIIVWLAGITVGAFCSIAVYQIFNMAHYMIVYSVIIVLSLVTICVSYLAIRTRLNYKVPAIATAHNRQSVERNTKLSKTLFIVIGASIAFWVPSLVYYCMFYFSSGFPVFLNYIFSMLTLTNSLINPIIYSLRMPMFRETLKRLQNKLRIRKQSENYTVDCEAFKMRTAKETAILTHVSSVNNCNQY